MNDSGLESVLDRITLIRIDYIFWIGSELLEIVRKEISEWLRISLIRSK